MRELDKTSTPDVGLCFAAWLRRARRSPWRKLIYRVRDYSGAFHHRYDTEYERRSRCSYTHPYSRGARRTFYHPSQLPFNRPATGDFGSYRREYAFDGTQHDFECNKCSGRGQLTCTWCGGRGRRGRSGDERCDSCSGSGHKQCGRSEGEGQLVAVPHVIFTAAPVVSENGS